MPASSRIVYGRTFRITPAWLWLMQRASGLLLGPLVAVHMWVPDASMSRGLNAILLLIVLAHGYSGIRRIMQLENRSSLISVQAWAWLILVALFGLLIVLYGK